VPCAARFAAIRKLPAPKAAAQGREARVAAQTTVVKANRKEKVAAARAKTPAGKVVAKGAVAKGAGTKKKTTEELDAEMDKFRRGQKGGLDRELEECVPSACQSVCLPACLPVCLSACLPSCLSA